MALFEDLGAAPFATRAAQELRASGETARKRDPSTLVDLTPMEAQVARLVVQGLSNKDVAAQLWISPRTVAFHLRGAFATGWSVDSVQASRFQVRPDLQGFEFSKGGPKAWFAMVRRVFTRSQSARSSSTLVTMRCCSGRPELARRSGCCSETRLQKRQSGACRARSRSQPHASSSPARSACWLPPSTPRRDSGSPRP